MMGLDLETPVFDDVKNVRGERKFTSQTPLEIGHQRMYGQLRMANALASSSSRI